ncbi:Fatty acid desaturase [Tistlia consotensis]|uniref:Fatty acid desaturase n=1 Tax=Tistlia consotensis USBA 355 TaxID=560819 RepID=A0A1Y6BMF0_9PROT|nr:acyl-ACP desaturase [Tistlia consotensis]SMF08278.1 Fatty acid desaturase [Tistlia consotensis USBA 355]SNR35472.1 Fatty acid desaturase [Tistlia consotensis]
MTRKHWTLDDIPWDRFDRSKVDAQLVKIVKAASLVEYNADDYADYLCNVFLDDLDFQGEARRWAAEEVQHGEALGRWAQLVDPTWDFEAAVRRFRDGYRISVDATESVRGSRAGELVARCIVEVGTSSYYGSLGEASEEPVLRAVCQRIAADELRHYKLFYDYLKRYLDKENIGRLRRLLIALGRMRETEDDELSYAYYAANAPASEGYDRKRWSDAYMGRAYRIYRRKYVDRATAMTLKAAGLDPQSRLADWMSRGAYWMMKSRAQRLPEDDGVAA